jgi:1,4-dihydroxy-2-naphthoate octaprenyltransferase
MNAQIKTNSVQAWIRATRPRTLGAITCPVWIGSSLAYSKGLFSLNLFMLTWICSLLLQILANVVNDYGDFMRGSDTADRLGPPRAMQMGWITPSVMRVGIAAILLCSTSLGLILIAHGGPIILVLGIISTIMCIWYTAGPKPLAYIGFSEIAVLCLFGPMPVFGAYFVQTLSWPPEGIVLSIGPALLSTALIMTNNLRDISEDRKHNKRTVAVRFGEKISRYLIIFFVAGAGLSPLFLIIFYGHSGFSLLSLAALIFPARLFPMILSDPISAKFNLMLQAIGKSLYLFGLLMSLSLVCGGMFA